MHDRCRRSGGSSTRRATGRAPTPRGGLRSRAWPARRWSGCFRSCCRSCSPRPRWQPESPVPRRSARQRHRWRPETAATCPGPGRCVAAIRRCRGSSRPCARTRVARDRVRPRAAGSRHRRRRGSASPRRCRPRARCCGSLRPTARRPAAAHAHRPRRRRRRHRSSKAAAARVAPSSAAAWCSPSGLQPPKPWRHGRDCAVAKRRVRASARFCPASGSDCLDASDRQWARSSSATSTPHHSPQRRRIRRRSRRQRSLHPHTQFAQHWRPVALLGRDARRRRAPDRPRRRTRASSTA